jgi:N-acetylglucosaminyldiphosphoundecaprenol N-acetyl-beta-D-mannosaminyltransferase
MESRDTAAVNILGCKVHLVDMPAALEAVTQMIDQAQGCKQVVTLNAEIIYQAGQQDELRRIINKADLVTADGIGTVWAARTLGCPQKERVSGIDLLMNICSRAAVRGWKVYLLGGAPGVALKAARNLERLYPGLTVCGCRDGYFPIQDEPDIIAAINAESPHILFAALGAPKQEYWLSRHREILKVPVCMGVGGSFDVIAGIKQRAPQLFIKLNLEWLYRLLTEPSRFKRQLALPAFALKVLRQKRSRGRNKAAR